VAPTASDAADGATFTVATGIAVTVSVACPVLPPADAMICVCPAVRVVIEPLDVIAATAGVPADQVTVPVPIAAPFWSIPEALAVADCPIWTVVGETETDRVVSTGVGAVGVLLFPPPPPLQAAKRTQTATMPRTS
jgi:hypothetical protein